MNQLAHEFKETVLKLENVNFSYEGKPVLRDVNMEIKNVVRPGVTQGQVVGLLGPSGMGKTTLFRLLAGLDVPDSGQVLLGEAAKPVQRGMVGVVAQNYPLFMHRTVLGNLLVAGKQSDLKGAAVRERADGLMRRFGISNLASKFPCQLSGGQRQRVAIAQQFMCSEQFLLMDEPFSGLDLLAQERVIGFIREIALSDELSTFILVTHDISAALQICDTIWLLGRDRDADGNPIPGARVQASFSLMERGLAWRENITTTPEYMQLRQEIRDFFPRL